ncbi:MAG: energy transducer TonB, partial [Dongiaceae bacterium]
APAEPDPVLEATLPDPVIEPLPAAVAEPLPAPAVKPEEPATALEIEPVETVAEPPPAPAPVTATAPQTAGLPEPATALGSAPDNLETGGAGFEPARYDVAALSNPEPDYPWASRRAGEEGRVVLRVEVSAAGTVDAIDVAESSGHRRLDEAALEAVRQWRFEPARVGEQPIATSVSVPITFRLE